MQTLIRMLVGSSLLEEQNLLYELALFLVLQVVIAWLAFHNYMKVVLFTCEVFCMI